MAGPLDSVFSGGESGMAVMLKGRVFSTVELILPEGSQEKGFILASGYLRALSTSSSSLI